MRHDDDESRDPYVPPFLRKKMPKASEEELLEATENLRLFLAAKFQACLRIVLEEEAQKRARQKEITRRNEGDGQLGLS